MGMFKSDESVKFRCNARAAMSGLHTTNHQINALWFLESSVLHKDVTVTQKDVTLALAGPER